jgi:hypothetical protein
MAKLSKRLSNPLRYLNRQELLSVSLVSPWLSLAYGVTVLDPPVLLEQCYRRVAILWSRHLSLQAFEILGLRKTCCFANSVMQIRIDCNEDQFSKHSHADRNDTTASYRPSAADMASFLYLSMDIHHLASQYETYLLPSVSDIELHPSLRSVLRDMGMLPRAVQSSWLAAQDLAILDRGLLYSQVYATAVSSYSNSRL